MPYKGRNYKEKNMGKLSGILVRHKAVEISWRHTAEFIWRHIALLYVGQIILWWFFWWIFICLVQPKLLGGNCLESLLGSLV